MKTIDRTQATPTIEVSTVRTSGGRSPRFETAIIVSGEVSEARVTHSVDDARREHDHAIAVVRGHGADASSARAAFWVAQFASLVA